MKRSTFELSLTFLFGNFPLPWRTTLGRKQAVTMRPRDKLWTSSWTRGNSDIFAFHRFHRLHDEKSGENIPSQKDETSIQPSQATVVTYLKVPIIQTLFQPKNVFFHTRFQTWLLKSIPALRVYINYVIIAEIKTATKRFLKTHFEFAYNAFF